MSAAAEKANVLTQSAIKAYEEEVGVSVAGSAVLEDIFHQLYLAYLNREKLGESKFRRIIPHA
jgi:hypothetical protein